MINVRQSVRGRPRIIDSQAVREALPEQMTALSSLPRVMVDYLSFYGLAPMARRYGYAAGRLLLSDAELVVQSFCQPQGNAPRALLVHGYMDHAALTGPLAEFLLQSGCDVSLYDLPGHGLSRGRPYEVDNFFKYTDQLGALVKRMLSEDERPLTLIGHSTGGAIITTLLLREPALLDQSLTRPVLLAPLVRPTHWPSIRRKYRWLGFWLRRVRRIYQANSHDPAFVEFIRSRDPLQHPWISVRWIGAMLRWIEWVEHQPASPARPLIIQGCDDDTVEWRHNLAVLQRLFPRSEQLCIDGARHNLINEGAAWRDPAFRAIGQLLRAETETPGALAGR
ncbi:alpha/beta fold hydrolase [Marinobacterium litorale]|uniref:alpha/beta fold hydrolase n=1 Tax=Marinobacterium litorale TaxID=404770 RepID=UPI00040DAFCB|nr:alpha/beta fold hydrolase [Marinobacterium litorale]